VYVVYIQSYGKERIGLREEAMDMAGLTCTSTDLKYRWKCAVIKGL
jgi:hypothetical protein